MTKWFSNPLNKLYHSLNACMHLALEKELQGMMRYKSDIRLFNTYVIFQGKVNY